MKLVEFHISVPEGDGWKPKKVWVNPIHIIFVGTKENSDNDGQARVHLSNDGILSIEESSKAAIKKINDALAGADVVLTVGRGAEATRISG